MKRNIIRISALLLAVLLAGCAQRSSTPAKGYSATDAGFSEVYGETAAMADMAATGSTAPRSGAVNGANSPVQVPEGRKWVINMNLSAECADLDEALASIAQQVESLGGYMESQSINNAASRQRRSASMTIRIPADKSDSFVQLVSGETNVTSMHRSVTDITLVYTDTAGRITALQAEETRLLELMAQAENMADLLAIEARLTDVRYELESYSSTLRLYDNQVDYATITLSLTQVAVYTPVEEPGFSERIAKGLKTSLEDLGDFLVDAAATLIIDLPYLIIFTLIGWISFLLIRRSIRKRISKKASENQAVKK